MSNETDTPSSKGGAGVQTKELEVIKKDVVDSFVDTIHSRYLKIHHKAKEFIDSVMSLADACNNFADHCKSKQLQIDGKNVDFVTFINKNKDSIGFGYSQFNKYKSLKGKDSEIRELLIEGKPEYIECFGVPVTPSVDNIKLALGNKNPWEESKPIPVLTEFQKQEQKLKKIQKKLEESIAKRASLALSVIETAEQKKKRYQDLADEASKKISDAKKVITEASNSIPKKSKESDKPEKEVIDVNALAQEVDALASV